MADLEHGARLQVRVEAGASLSLVHPEASLDDLVLGRELRGKVDDFVAAARVRSTVLTEWGFGKSLRRGTGMTALFSGPPGTGKSATAEAIATALERPMLRCSLASIISKWVGDTTKNLEQLFKTAREQRAVLVFDEAESLFGRRVQVTTANDRFVNAETGALLTQLERHDGVVILTTNLVREIDPAFERRIGLRATFTAPDAHARAAIWKALLPVDAPLASDVNVTELARVYELTGAQVRNALLAAALKAATRPLGERRITQAMLRAAAQSEAGGVVVTETVARSDWS
jgi:SpoVK/Ycf46/Vps4 family AAA+-type ATPase